MVINFHREGVANHHIDRLIFSRSSIQILIDDRGGRLSIPDGSWLAFMTVNTVLR